MDITEAAKITPYPLDGVPLEFRGATFNVKRWTVAQKEKIFCEYEQRPKRPQESTTGEEQRRWAADDRIFWLEKCLTKKEAKQFYDLASKPWEDQGPWSMREITQMVDVMINLASGISTPGDLETPKEKEGS